MDDQGWQQAPRSRGPVPEGQQTGVYKRTARPPPLGAPGQGPGEAPQKAPSPLALRVRSEAPRWDMRDVAHAVEPLGPRRGGGCADAGRGRPSPGWTHRAALEVVVEGFVQEVPLAAACRALQAQIHVVVSAREPLGARGHRDRVGRHGPTGSVRFSSAQHDLTEPDPPLLSRAPDLARTLPSAASASSSATARRGLALPAPSSAAGVRTPVPCTARRAALPSAPGSQC